MQQPYRVLVEPPGITGNGYHPAASVTLSAGASIALRAGAAIDFSGTIPTWTLPSIAPFPTSSLPEILGPGGKASVTPPLTSKDNGKQPGGGGEEERGSDDGEGPSDDDSICACSGCGCDPRDGSPPQKTRTIVGVVVGLVLLFLLIAVAGAVWLKRGGTKEEEDGIPSKTTALATMTTMNPAYEEPAPNHGVTHGDAIANTTYDGVDADIGEDSGAIINPTYESASSTLGEEAGIKPVPAASSSATFVDFGFGQSYDDENAYAGIEL